MSQFKTKNSKFNELLKANENISERYTHMNSRVATINENLANFQNLLNVLRTTPMPGKQTSKTYIGQ